MACGKDTGVKLGKQRLWKRSKEGAKGLAAPQRGKSSNCAKPEEFRRKVLAADPEEVFGNGAGRFGPRWQRSISDEDGLEVGEETLRRGC